MLWVNAPIVLVQPVSWSRTLEHRAREVRLRCRPGRARTSTGSHKSHPGQGTASTAIPRRARLDVRPDRRHRGVLRVQHVDHGHDAVGTGQCGRGRPRRHRPPRPPGAATTAAQLHRPARTGDAGHSMEDQAAKTAATYRRTGGGRPSLDEELEIEPDGTFRMLRRVSVDRAGTFAGTLRAPRRDQLLAALDELGDPVVIRPDWPGVVLELVGWAGARRCSRWRPRSRPSGSGCASCCSPWWRTSSSNRSQRSSSGWTTRPTSRC